MPANVLHQPIEHGADFRAVFELAGNLLIVLAVLQALFVAQLVLQTRPKVHRNRAQLDFHAHPFGFVAQENRHLHDEVQAAVAVRLRVLDVVLPLNQRDVILPQQRIREQVNVLRKRADDAHTGDVIEVFLDGAQRHRQIAPLELFKDALRTFQPRLDGLNRVVFSVERHLHVEHAELGLDLHRRTAVIRHHLLERIQRRVRPLGRRRDQLGAPFRFILRHIYPSNPVFFVTCCRFFSIVSILSPPAGVNDQRMTKL